MSPWGMLPNPVVSETVSYLLRLSPKERLAQVNDLNKHQAWFYSSLLPLHVGKLRDQLFWIKFLVQFFFKEIRF